MVFDATKVDGSRVAVYIRWSTEEQGNGTTLEVQRDGCRHFLLSQGWEFREELVFVDDGYSGANMNRPAITRLREAVKQGRISAVVIYKLDRLSRNLLDCVTLVRQEWSRIGLFSTMEHFDTQSPLGQMVFNILVSFAEFERNVIRERTMSGKRKRREQGRNSGFAYPYGYRKSGDGGFAIDPGQAAVVRQMFADYLSGLGMKVIAERLNSQSIPAPRGGLWRACTVRVILANPFYAGHYVGGFYTYDGGKQKRGEAPTFRLDGAVPAIVAQGDYDRAQAVRKERLAPGFTSARSGDYILTTVLRCARCGGPMSGHSAASHVRYYRCVNSKDLGVCDCGAVPAEELEQRVLTELRRDLSPDYLWQHIALLDQKRQEEIGRRREAVAAIDARLAELGRRREKLDADYFAERLDPAQYARLSAPLDAQTQAAAVCLAEAEKEVQALEKTPVDRERLTALAQQLDGLAELDARQVRSLLRQLLASLTVYRPKQRGRWGKGPTELTIEHNANLLPTA